MAKAKAGKAKAAPKAAPKEVLLIARRFVRW